MLHVDHGQWHVGTAQGLYYNTISKNFPFICSILDNLLQTPQKKAQQTTEYVALGTRSGGVSLYSFSKSEVSSNVAQIYSWILILICLIPPDRVQSEGGRSSRCRHCDLSW